MPTQPSPLEVWMLGRFECVWLFDEKVIVDYLDPLGDGRHQPWEEAKLQTAVALEVMVLPSQVK